MRKAGGSPLSRANGSARRLTVWKWALGLAILSVLLLSFWYDLGPFFSIENLKEKEGELRSLYERFPFAFVLAYLGIYVLSVALSLPVATVLTLAGGALFGFWLGTFLSSVASTVGATLAFLASRFLFRDWVQQKFGSKLESINRGFQRDGASYLFTLRLVPLFPFFIVNAVMALTPISAVTFFFVSQLAMLPGTAAYVNAGTQLSKINSAKDIVSWQILASFAAIGLVPLVAKKIANWRKTHNLRDQ